MRRAARGRVPTRAARSPNGRNRGTEATRLVRPIQPSSTRPQLTRATGRVAPPALASAPAGARRRPCNRAKDGRFFRFYYYCFVLALYVMYVP